MALALPRVGIGSYPSRLLPKMRAESYTRPFISLFTAGTLTGFDASGHIAEETKNAR